MSVKSKKEETIGKLNTLAESYEKWINSTLLGNGKMSNPDFKDKIGNKVIERCLDALKRIREGISIIENDDISFEAFCFMNRVIFLQNSIKGYAKKHGTGTECNFQDFINPKNPDNNFGWRPFQIAFILMNLAESLIRNIKTVRSLTCFTFLQAAVKQRPTLALWRS